MNDAPYAAFLNGPAKTHWEKVSVRRRAGVCVPLFSLHSADSVGIGDLHDVNALVDWCAQVGLSIVQLLPLNDVGYDFAPYSAKSSFALDPMYLSLRKLDGVDTAKFAGELRDIARAFPIGARVNYAVKSAKMALLWKMYQARTMPEPARFARFQDANTYWLRDDALYKTCKTRFQGAPWEEWPLPYRQRTPEVMKQLAEEEKDAVRFHEWVQWQLFEQFDNAKRHARRKGVLFMGDMPFLVARDSADVWAHPNYFKLDLSAGAPPDLYFAGGQRWGMPPYNWPVLAEAGYDYLVQKLRYAENFYDLYRIDHVIGVFRVFTIPLSSPAERQGLDGVFDPPDESLWEEHGRRLLTTMLGATRMLPCGEDLGVVPPCSYKVLADLSIPGLDVMRWARDWGKTNDFNPSESYRPNAVAVASTHDMTPVATWWKHEVATVDDYFFQLKCAARRLDYETTAAKLFEPSVNGRRRWKPEIETEEVFLWNLGIPAERAADFLDLFRSTRFEREAFWKFLGLSGRVYPKPTPRFVQRVMEKANESSSVFSVQLFQDWLATAGVMSKDLWADRINLPGSMGPHNWSYVSPLSLEELAKWPGNRGILELNKRTGRA